MIEIIRKVIAKVAFDAAIQSAKEASYCGLYQMEEPKELQKIANSDDAE